MPTLQSFAKINLGLEIVGKRPDGYHLLRTVFQTIDLHDTIRVETNDQGRLNLRGDDPHVAWDESNTLHRSWDLFQKKFGRKQGFDLFVKKRIPPGSGLGGGSSNAGAFLLFLCDFFHLDASDRELIELAVLVGSDVPFFIIGGTALGEGIGEKLTSLPDIPERDFILVMPKIAVSTRLVFSRFVLTKGAFAGKMNIFLKERDFAVLENQLEPTTMELFPEIREIKRKMLAGGCEMVQMSGSGSALFGIAPADRIPALKFALPDLNVCRTIGQKNYQERMFWGVAKRLRHRSLEPRFGGSNPPTPEDQR